MSTENKPAKNSVSQFVELLNQGLQAWNDAAAIARENIAKDPEWPDKVAEACPMLSPDKVRAFCKIGQTVHVNLFLASGSGPNALRRLPIALQDKYVSEPVAVLIANGESLLVDVNNLTPDQASQVFAHDGVRSLAAQRAWLEDKAMKAKPIAKKADVPYRVTGGKLVVMVAGTTFTRKDLAKFVAEMD